MSFLITSVFPPTLLLIHFLLVALFANEQLQFRLWLYVALLSTSGMISYSSLFFIFPLIPEKQFANLDNKLLLDLFVINYFTLQ